jgi:hypothetical protein
MIGQIIIIIIIVIITSVLRPKLKKKFQQPTPTRRVSIQPPVNLRIMDCDSVAYFHMLSLSAVLDQGVHVYLGVQI